MSKVATVPQLKELKQRGLTHKQIAAGFGVSYQTVQKWFKHPELQGLKAGHAVHKEVELVEAAGDGQEALSFNMELATAAKPEKVQKPVAPKSPAPEAKAEAPAPVVETPVVETPVVETAAENANDAAAGSDEW